MQRSPEAAGMGPSTTMRAATASKETSQLTLTASSNDNEILADAERQLIDCAKWDHRDTTEATRRALQVSSIPNCRPSMFRPQI